MPRIPQDENFFERARKERSGSAGEGGITLPGTPRRRQEGTFLQRRRKEKLGALKLSIDEGRDLGAERAAKIVSLAQQTRLHPSLVAADPEGIEAEVAAEGFDPKAFERSPVVTRILSESGAFAGVAPEDLPDLPNYENYLRRPRELWPLSEKEIDGLVEREAARRAEGSKGIFAEKAFLRRVEEFSEVPGRFPSPEARGAAVRKFTAELPEEEQAEFEKFRSENLERFKKEARDRILAYEKFVNGTREVGVLETIGRRFAENPLFPGPFLGTAVNIQRLEDLRQAADAIRLEELGEGKATPAQRDLLLLWGRAAMAAEERGDTFLAKVSGLILDNTAFMAEFATTSGQASLTKFALRRAAAESLEGTLRRSIQKVLTNRASQFLLSSAAQTAVRAPLRVAEETIQRVMPGIAITPDQAGELTAVFTAEGGDFWGALAKSAGSQFVEGVAERSGVALEKITGPVKMAIARRWLRINPEKGVPGFISKLKEKSGWNGVVEEVFEERVGDVLRFGLQVDDEFRIPTAEDLAAEALAFGVPGAGFGALQGTEALVRRAFRTTEPKFFRDYGRRVSKLKLQERAPELFERVTREAVKGGPNETLYAPLDAWEGYWQSQKDEEGNPVDGRRIYQDLGGDPARYDQAVAADGTRYLEVPFEKYARYLAPTEHNDPLADIFKVDPMDANPAEVLEFFPETEAPAEGEAAEGSAKASIPEAPVEAPQVESAARVGQAVRELLVAAGRRPRQAALEAQLLEEFFRVQGIRENIDPLELLQGVGLDVRRSDLNAQILERRLSQLIDERRTLEESMKALRADVKSVKKEVQAGREGLTRRLETALRSEIRSSIAGVESLLKDIRDRGGVRPVVATELLPKRLRAGRFTRRGVPSDELAQELSDRGVIEDASSDTLYEFLARAVDQADASKKRLEEIPEEARQLAASEIGDERLAEALESLIANVEEQGRLREQIRQKRGEERQARRRGAVQGFHQAERSAIDGGPVFRQFRHDAAGAIEALRQAQAGEAVAALHHPDVGDIDLIWGKAGKKGFGLAKIERRHPEVLGDLQGFIEGLSVREENDNSIILETADGRAVVRLNWMGQSKRWLLTAFATRKPDQAGETIDVTNRPDSAGPADRQALPPLEGREDSSLPPDDLDSQVQEFEQAARREDGPRGRTRFEGDPSSLEGIRTTIELFPTADLSTFLHESGHLFLEIMGRLAMRPEASAELRSDFEAILEWADVKDLEAWATMSTAERKAAHEKFARGFEAYLREGEAPSITLRRAFRKFRAWLLRIYQTLRGLNVQLTPEVRAVMDRMLATQEEIDAAREEQQAGPLFEDLVAAGFSDEKAREYSEAIREASDVAEERVTQETLKGILKVTAPALEAERKRIREEIEAELNRRREYVALAFLQKGKRPDGAELPEGVQAFKISRASLVEQFGEEILRRLPRPLVYTRKAEGVSVDDAARVLGFTSGAELVEVLTRTERKEELVRRLVDERMRAAHDEFQVAGRLEEEARRAIQTDKRARILRLELEHLIRMSLPKFKGLSQLMAERLPRREVLRQAIERELQRERKLSEVKPGLFAAAMRKAGREARKAFLRGDIEAAFEAKLRELAHWERHRAAEEILDQVEHGIQFAKRMERDPAQKRLGKAGESYQDAMNDVLARYALGTRARRRTDRAGGVAEWIRDVEAETGIRPVIEDFVLEGSVTSHRDLTPEQFSEVLDALKHIDHLAVEKFTIMAGEERRLLDDVAVELSASMRDKALSSRPDPERAEVLKKLRKFGKEMLASLLNIDTITRELDGFEDLGSANRHLKGVIDDTVANKLFPMQSAAGEAIEKLFEAHYSKREIRRLAKTRVRIPALAASLTRAEILAVALNRGNEGNEAALIRSDRFHPHVAKEKVSEQDLDAITDTLDKRDWDFVQAVWDYVDTYWADIKAAQLRRTGVAPPKVAARPIKTKFGTYAGGYYPLYYSSEESTKVSEESFDELVKGLRAGRFGREHTARGHTQKRIGSGGRPVALDLAVLHKHVQRVVYDLALGDAVNYVSRTLNHGLVRRTFEDLGKVEEWNTLDIWLKDVATGEIPPTDFISRMFRWVRKGRTVSAMGWNIRTGIIQQTGYLQSLVVLGPKYMRKGVTTLLSREFRREGGGEDRGAWRQVFELSQFMRDRAQTFNKDIFDTVRELRGGLIPDVILKSFFWHIGKSQQLVDVVTWLGAYHKGMDQFGKERDAITFADQAVKRAQASGLFSDRTAIERGTLGRRTQQSEVVRTFTTFMSYMLVKGNVAYERTRSVSSWKNPIEVLKYGLDMLLLFSIEGLILAAITGAWPDDEEEIPAFVAQQTGKEIVSTLPFVREVVSAKEGFDTGGAIGAVIGQTARVWEQVDQGEFDLGLWKNLNSLGGTLFHYPSSQLNRFIDAVWRDSEGEDVSILEYFIFRERD